MAKKKKATRGRMSREKGTKKCTGDMAGSTLVITGPSAEELRPTEEMQQELKCMTNWEKRSAERDWVIGRP